MAAVSLSNSLRNLMDQELRLNDTQALLDKRTAEKSLKTPADLLDEVGESILSRWMAFRGGLERLRDEVEQQFSNRPVGPTFRRFDHCCSLTNLHYSPQWGLPVNKSLACDVLPPSSVDFNFQSFCPSASALLPTFQSNLGIGGMGWQWVRTAEGAGLEFPAHRLGNASQCRENEARRADFIAAALPHPKRVVILLEYGNLVSESQLERVRGVGKVLLEGIGGVGDEVSVVGVGEEASSPCPALLPATQTNKARLRDFIHSQPRLSRLLNIVEGEGGMVFPNTTSATNHSRGFVEAYRILGSSARAPDSRDYILYVSRGLLSSLADKAKVLATIARLSLHYNLRDVQINTFPVLQQRPLWETQFLGDVAQQNFAKHKASFPPSLQKSISALNPPKGKARLMAALLFSTTDNPSNDCIEMVVVNESSLSAALPLSVSLSLFSAPAASSFFVSRPGVGTGGRGGVAAALSLLVKEELVGVVGGELTLTRLTAPLTKTTPLRPRHRLLLLHREAWLVHDGVLTLHQHVLIHEYDSWAGTRKETAELLDRLQRETSGYAQVKTRTPHNLTTTLHYTWKEAITKD